MANPTTEKDAVSGDLVLPSDCEYSPEAPGSLKGTAAADACEHGLMAASKQRPGYYSSPFVIGSIVAIGLSAMAGIGGFALAASLLTMIDQDIGPSDSITWVSLVYLVTQAVTQTLVGRLSDLFGRRWFFIGSNIIALVGSIICACAQNVDTLIGGNTLVGIASAAQVSFPYVLVELVPMNWRFFSMAYVYILVIPFTGIGPVISSAFAYQTSVSWRGIYYLMIAIDAVAAAAFFLFYHPPTFSMKHARDKHTKLQILKDFDYIGLVLFAGGFVVFLLGLQWGGVMYPWKSAPVIGTMAVGGMALISFVLWELYAPIKEPLVPMHLFANGGWVASTILLSCGVCMYYAFYLVWPQQVAALYSQDTTYDSWLSCSASAPMLLGQMTGGLLARSIGKTKYQLISFSIASASFLGGAACVNASNKNTVVALLVIGNYCVGWIEALTQTMVSIVLDDQQEIGVAVGISSSIRSGFSSIATAVFTAVLSNRLATTIPEIVPPAVTSAGLPPNSVESFLTAISSGSQEALQAVPGITERIISVGAAAYKDANAEAYSTVYLCTLAFSGLGIAVSFFTPNVDDKMTGEVAALIHKAE